MGKTIRVVVDWSVKYQEAYAKCPDYPDLVCAAPTISEAYREMLKLIANKESGK
jgi:hypothetical protein